MRVVGHLARCAGHIVVLARERAHPRARAYTPGLPRDRSGLLRMHAHGLAALARARYAVSEILPRYGSGDVDKCIYCTTTLR